MHCTIHDQNPSHIYVYQVPNGPLDKDGLDEALAGSKLFYQHLYFLYDSDGGISQAGSSYNSSQLPPVVIVPGLMSSRTEEGGNANLRGRMNLSWRSLQLKRGQARLSQHGPNMGRAGQWPEKMDSSSFSRIGSTGVQTEVEIIVNSNFASFA